MSHLSKDTLLKFALAFIALAFSGCNAYQHVSSPVYVPWNKRKGDTKLNIWHNQIQAGYAVSNNISLFTTAFTRKRTTNRASGWFAKEGVGSRHFEEEFDELNIGVSYFKATDRVVWEIVAGGGGGDFYYSHVDNLELPYSFYVLGSRSNIFISPSFSFTTKPEERSYIEIGGFAKIAGYRYSNLRTYVSQAANDQRNFHYDQYFIGEMSRNFLFIEPGFCMRAGGKNVKGNMIFSVPINTAGYVVRSKDVNLYISLFVDFNVFGKRKSD